MLNLNTNRKDSIKIRSSIGERKIDNLDSIGGVCGVARMRALSKRRVSGKQHRTRAHNKREYVFQVTLLHF
jgi:hypothetical protein